MVELELLILGTSCVFEGSGRVWIVDLEGVQRLPVLARRDSCLESAWSCRLAESELTY